MCGLRSRWLGSVRRDELRELKLIPTPRYTTPQLDDLQKRFGEKPGWRKGARIR